MNKTVQSAKPYKKLLMWMNICCVRINEKGSFGKQFKLGEIQWSIKINFLMSSLLKIGHA